MSSDSAPKVLSGDAPPPHRPFVPAEANIPEFTWSALLLGSVLGIVFGASSLYLVLKVGMTVSASIPIAVLSITLFRAFRPLFGRNATILENNLVQTTGSAGESIAFGVGVTMPALLILGYNLEYVRIALVAVLGGLLGILMMIPLRRAFIVRQHGKLAYPEGTACADVLIVGESGGTSARLVFGGFGLGFLFWFLANGMRFFKEIPEKALGFFRGAVVSAEIGPHLLGVGYIIGTRISCIMVGGGVLAAWVLTPMIVFFGQKLSSPLYPAESLIRDMGPSQIRSAYVLYIGAGAVATGGIISMIQAMPMIAASIRSGLKDLAGRGAAARSAGGGAGNDAGDGAGPRGGRVQGVAAVVPRTERDLPMKVVLVGLLGLVIAIWAAPMLKMNLVGALCIVVFGFLFVTVSSRLVGEIGSSSNPISGMTVATLLMTCLIFLALGWTDDKARLTALSVAGIVCIAASNGGTTSQDLKTGFLVGGTPKFMQMAIIVGALTSAFVIGVTLLVLNDGGTVYSKKDLPPVAMPLTGQEIRERVRGPYGAQDRGTYLARHVRVGQVAGIPAGKYLCDADGTIRYLVDPGVNGRLAQQDDGTPVQKYDAPKAALMSFLIDGILSRQMPWTLVLLGVALALVLELAGIPSLPFAVGVYLPLSASMPIFVGGVARWVVEKRLRRGGEGGEMSPGILLSSGLIAGGTIAGIVGALISLRVNLAVGPRILGSLATSNLFAAVMFGLLSVFLVLVGAERLLKAKRG
jgi:putative OPT family oligopeptide transporter